MRERAELAGGWLRISSERDAGTTVEFWIPLSFEPPAEEPAS
jgi:signal transduction histidine kinase